MPEDVANHYARLYGSRVEKIINGASSLKGLGRHFGGTFYEAEATYLRTHEWAQTAEDILDRRTNTALISRCKSAKVSHAI